MNSKHTPGPFRIGRANRQAAVYGPKGEWLATLPDLLDHEEIVANQKLFAAAPDLLAALQACEALLDGRQPRDIPGALMVIRSALSKAKA